MSNPERNRDSSQFDNILEIRQSETTIEYKKSVSSFDI